MVRIIRLGTTRLIPTLIYHLFIYIVNRKSLMDCTELCNVRHEDKTINRS